MRRVFRGEGCRRGDKFKPLRYRYTLEEKRARVAQVASLMAIITP